MQLCYINISIHKNQKGFTMAFCSFSPLNSFNLCFLKDRGEENEAVSSYILGIFTRIFSMNEHRQAVFCAGKTG